MITARVTPVGTLPTAHPASEAMVVSPQPGRMDELAVQRSRPRLGHAVAPPVLPRAARRRLRLVA
jgi:hypothetical protein